jgi:hypothetical protein
MAQCGVVWPGMAWYGFVLVACYPSGATNYPLSENWSQTITDKAPCHLILGSGHNGIQDAWVVHTWLYQDAWFPVFSAHSNLVLQYPHGPMFMSHGRSWYPTKWGTDTEDSTKMTDQSHQQCRMTSRDTFPEKSPRFQFISGKESPEAWNRLLQYGNIYCD